MDFHYLSSICFLVEANKWSPSHNLIWEACLFVLDRYRVQLDDGAGQKLGLGCAIYVETIQG
jgi:hypothetical protein